jgi:hypothetical protein|nr:MAG TPA: hypothetical protein [Caudoviricetes sp.]
MKYIIVKAFTDSDWDTCDYALIKIDGNTIGRIQEQQKAIGNLMKDSRGIMNSFCKMCFYTSIVEFYCFDEEVITEDENNLEKPYIIDLSEEQLQKLLTPEARLELYKYELYSYNSLRFTAYGKYSGDEFYTDDFDIVSLIKDEAKKPLDDYYEWIETQDN